MVHTPDFKVSPRYLAVMTILARLLGGLWILGGILAVVTSFVESSSRVLYLFCGVFLIAVGLAFIFVKPVPVADSERWRRRMGFHDSGNP